MKKNQKLYYYEYDESNEKLKIIEGIYNETQNGLLILNNIFIPRSMVHTNKRFTSFNCNMINKKLSKIAGDKYLYAMPFVTGVYKNIFDKIFKNIIFFVKKNSQLYILGLIKLPFIPFLRYFENRKNMANVKTKILLFEKSAEHYKKLAEADAPQTEQDVYKFLGGTSFDDIKKKYKNEYNQIQSKIHDLEAEKKEIKKQETDLSNMTFSLIISFSSLVVATIALVLTCRQPADMVTSKGQDLESETTSVSFEDNKTSDNNATSNDKEDAFPENESGQNNFPDVPELPPLDLQKSNLPIPMNTPVFKEYKESPFKK